MITTEFESSVTLSTETWNMARMITESQQEAEELVQDIFNEHLHFPEGKREIAVMMHINLLASKVMTRH